MKKNFNHMDSFYKMHSNVMDILAFFLVENNYDVVTKKCEECQNNGRIMGENPECYGCLLKDEEARKKLDNVLDHTPLKDVFMYQNMIGNIAKKHNIRKYKLLCDVLESAMYTKML